MKRLFVLILLLLTTSAFAQQISVGAELNSRYIWRGLELSDAPNIQPSLYLQLGSFRIGTWGSYAVSNQQNSWEEVDFYANYTYSSDYGDFTLGVTNYYFPGRDIPWTDWTNPQTDSTGAHLIEAGLLYNWLFFDVQYNVNVYGDDDYTQYGEIGVSFGNENVGSLRAFLGFTPGSNYNVMYNYNAEDFAFTNLGLKVTSKVGIIPIYVMYTMNPHNEVSYLVFGITL